MSMNASAQGYAVVPFTEELWHRAVAAAKIDEDAATPDGRTHPILARRDVR